MRSRGMLPLVALAAAAVGFLAGREIWPREPRFVGRVIRVESPAWPPVPPAAERGPGTGDAPADAPEDRAPAADGDVTPPPWMKIDIQDGEPVLRRHGPWVEHHPNGRVKTEGEYVDGKPVGVWRSFDESGALTHEARYEDGRLHGEETVWHRNGVVRWRGSWREGVKEGTFTHWDADGNPVREEQWSAGSLAAPIRLWDPKGEFPPEAEALEKAAVGGKYRSLLRKVAAPEDRGSYGDFKDYGLWSGAGYMGHTDLPQGYWVYVYPYWYIWAEKLAE